MFLGNQERRKYQTGDVKMCASVAAVTLFVPKSGVEVGAGNGVARPLVAVPRLCGENTLVGTKQARRCNNATMKVFYCPVGDVER
jgi:hypothetical protein